MSPAHELKEAASASNDSEIDEAALILAGTLPFSSFFFSYHELFHFPTLYFHIYHFNLFPEAPCVCPCPPS